MEDTTTKGKCSSDQSKKEDVPKTAFPITGSKRVSQSPPKSTQVKTTGKFVIKSNEKKSEATVIQKKKAKLAAVFNDDSESEDEMPLECRMKMRNIGRDTITSAGPKSFNKGKTGFNNPNFKQFELSMKPRNNMEKQNPLEDPDK